MVFYESLTTSDLEATVANIDRNRYHDEFRKRLYGRLCVYCGEIATSLDHFPPAVCTPVGLLLPACKECNCIASTEYSYDFLGRSLYVTDKLRTKYKRFVQNPSWSNKEMLALGYNLRMGVKEWQNIRSIALSRIAWNAMIYMASIDHNSYFAQFDARTHTTTNLEKNNLKIIEAQKQLAQSREIETENKWSHDKICVSCETRFSSTMDTKYCSRCRKLIDKYWK